MFINVYILLKEVVTESLLLGAVGVVLILNNGDFIGDLPAKVAIGWLLEYIVLTIIAFNGVVNTFLIW
jgi:hypothetical protein